jgi:hypothetical protein
MCVCCETDFRAGTGALHSVENSQSRAEFQLSHKCVWRMMRLFVVAMEKIGNCKLFERVVILYNSRD